MPATATRPARAAPPGRAPGRPSQRPARPPLRSVPAPGRRGRASRGRPALVLSAVLVVGSLLVVMATHAYLVQGQVGLAKLDQRLSAEETTHRDLEQRVAQLEAPDRIVSQAQRQGLVAPKVTNDLPQVPLSTGASGSSTTATTSPTSPSSGTGSASSGPASSPSASSGSGPASTSPSSGASR